MSFLFLCDTYIFYIRPILEMDFVQSKTSNFSFFIYKIRQELLSSLSHNLTGGVSFINIYKDIYKSYIQTKKWWVIVENKVIDILV